MAEPIIYKRRKFTDYEKKTVYSKCNGRCAICGNPIKFNDITIDHKIPLSQGGDNSMPNLQLACRKCNLMKSGFSETEFYQKIAEVLWYHRMEQVKTFVFGEVE